MSETIKLSMSKEQFFADTNKCEASAAFEALKRLRAAFIDEPLPCPFCGTFPMNTGAGLPGAHRFYCPNQKCWANDKTYLQTEAEAVEQWNRRAK